MRTRLKSRLNNKTKEYTESIPQSDDITMLIFKYNGASNDIRTFKQTAVQENYNNFYNWVRSVSKEWNIGGDLTNKLDMCAEEIFANIAFYAYPEAKGDIEATLEKSNGRIVFEFKDEGVEYNPLERPDPDITLPPEERPIGGLGIFMVKEMADEISYKRVDNKNVLTLIFKV